MKTRYLFFFIFFVSLRCSLADCGEEYCYYSCTFVSYPDEHFYTDVEIEGFGFVDLSAGVEIDMSTPGNGPSKGLSLGGGIVVKDNKLEFSFLTIIFKSEPLVKGEQITIYDYNDTNGTGWSIKNDRSDIKNLNGFSDENKNEYKLFSGNIEIIEIYKPYDHLGSAENGIFG